MAGALLLAACSGGTEDGGGNGSTDAAAPSGDTTDAAAPSGDKADGPEGSDGDAADASAGDGTGSEDGPEFDYSGVDYDAEPADSALRGDRNNPAFPPPLIDPSLIRSGGPPPDGIPPIDDPGFIAVDEVDNLTDDEAVILVELDGLAKAYPVRILIWHEIVNDTFGDVPVAVTYCPLCNSALAFDRRLGDRVLDFGTSGSLYQSALVMYDRQTESLWAHFTGRGLVGHYAGAELGFIPAQTVSWAQFRDTHPDGLVLSEASTGAQRPYGQNPYPGYDREDSDPIGGFFNGPVDPTLAAKARIVGVADDAGSVAVRLEDLADQPVIPITEDGRNLVVFYQPGLASALDAVEVDGGREIGQTGVFEATTSDGTALTFQVAGDPDDGRFEDDQTGSTWNVLGRAVDGPLAGESLTAVTHLDTFWFAWATYRPGTVVVDPPS